MGKIIYNGIDCGGGSGGGAVSDLTDVELTNLADGEILKYNASLQKWLNAVESGGGGGGNVYGAFIDTNRVIVPQTMVAGGTTASYTAVEDCAVVYECASTSGNNYGFSILIDDVEIGGLLQWVSSQYIDLKDAVYVKKGQTIKIKVDAPAWDYAWYKVYGLTQGTQGIFSPIIYSEEEREVGVWIDNKPLYAKSFHQQLSGDRGNIDISSLNVEHGWIYDGFYDIGVTSLGLNEILGSNNLTYTHLNAGLNPPYIDCRNYISANSTVYVTILYTKTTDVAGSGSYNTLGAPTVHYTTDEQVIGTWIDGKPLYQKSYENLNIGTVQNYTLTLSDLQNIEYFRVVPEGSQVSVLIPFPYVHYGTENLVGYLTDVTNGVPSLEIRKGSAASLSNLQFLTIQYTKTTD